MAMLIIKARTTRWASIWSSFQQTIGVRGAEAPSAHRTVRTGPYTAPHASRIHRSTSNQCGSCLLERMACPMSPMNQPTGYALFTAKVFDSFQRLVVGEHRFRRLAAWDATLDQFAEEIASALLLIHQTGSQSSPDMGFDLLQLGGVVGHRKIARPAHVPAVDPLDARLQSQVGTPRGQFLDFGHGRLQGLVGDRDGIPHNGYRESPR